MSKKFSIILILTFLCINVYTQNADAAGVFTKSSGGFPEKIIIKQSGNFIPQKFDVYQGCPNSFGPNSTIKFEVPFKSNVSLNLFDANNKLVCKLINDKFKAGIYTIEWLPEDKEGGIYICELVSGDLKVSKKMILSK